MDCMSGLYSHLAGVLPQKYSNVCFTMCFTVPLIYLLLFTLMIYSFISKNEEEYIKHLLFTFEQPRLHKFQAKMKESGFILHSLVYLAHVNESKAIKTDPSNISAVMNWPILCDLQQFYVFQALLICIISFNTDLYLLMYA